MDEENLEWPLLEALERYADTEDLRKYLEFKPFYSEFRAFFVGGRYRSPESPEEHARTLRKVLEESLLGKLCRGELVAYGHVYPLQIDAERVKISAGKWKLLTINFDHSTAEGHGLNLIDIVVRRPPAKESTSRGRKVDRLSQNQPIHEAFARLLASGNVSFLRGGLTAVSEKLALQFPTYKADSIRKIIQRSYKEAKGASETEK